MRNKALGNSAIIIVIIIFVISTVFVPVLINESYKNNTGYLTLWGASDLLLYFGSVISAIGTIFIGFIAMLQNRRANDINDRLLKIQEVYSTPFLHIDSSESEIQCLNSQEIDILIGLRNQTNGVINITKISSMHVTELKDKQIPFCKDWTTHYSILPNQTKQINFFVESKTGEQSLIADNWARILDEGFFQLICNIEIGLHFVGSADTYTQKVEFYLQGYQRKGDKSKYRIKFLNIENSMQKGKGTG